MKATLYIQLFAICTLAACSTTNNDKALAPANSETESVAENVEQVAHTPKKKKICRSEKLIGSKFKKRICYTQEQWDKVEEDSDRAMQELQKSIRAQSGCTGSLCH